MGAADDEKEMYEDARLEASQRKLWELIPLLSIRISTLQILHELETKIKTYRDEETTKHWRVRSRHVRK
eukprot:COSAG01_NODE_1056_length_11893_cov_439.683332_14_plen_69_part_00